MSNVEETEMSKTEAAKIVLKWVSKEAAYEVGIHAGALVMLAGIGLLYSKVQRRHKQVAQPLKVINSAAE